jgi:hypothetical protein
MSGGYSFACSECDFILLTGWSHDRGSDKCVCINCAIIFSIKGFKSTWGVEDGEVCKLYRPIEYKKQRKKNRDRPTEFDAEVQVVAETSSQEIILDSGKTITIEILTFGLEDITCPSCHKLGSLKLSLEAGDKCPKCQVGNIKNQGRIIY